MVKFALSEDEMDRYNRALNEQTQAEERRESQWKSFLSQFDEIQEKIILPIMQDIGEVIKTHGHDYRISPEPGRIVMEIFPGGHKSSISSIAFSASESSDQVSIHGTVARPRGGVTSGPRGEVQRGQFAKDTVEEEIMKLLTELFGPDTK